MPWIPAPYLMITSRYVPCIWAWPCLEARGLGELTWLLWFEEQRDVSLPWGGFTGWVPQRPVVSTGLRRKRHWSTEGEGQRDLWVDPKWAYRPHHSTRNVVGWTFFKYLRDMSARALNDWTWVEGRRGGVLLKTMEAGPSPQDPCLFGQGPGL